MTSLQRPSLNFEIVRNLMKLIILHLRDIVNSFRCRIYVHEKFT